MRDQAHDSTQIAGELRERFAAIRWAAPIYCDALRRYGTWLYAIQAGEDGPVKLGVTNWPPRRLATLQQGNPADLRGLAAWRGLPLEEKQLHDEFAHARIRGEWFRPEPELLDRVLFLGGIFDDWEKIGGRGQSADRTFEVDGLPTTEDGR